MSSWIPVREAIPWVPLPPYLLVAGALPQLRTALRDAGFELVEAEAGWCVDERAVLQAIGGAFGFPEHYGANWAAFDDCLSDTLEARSAPQALIVVGLESLLRFDLHAFLRTVHQLQQSVEDARKAPDELQMEVFFVGDFPSPEPRP